MPRRTISQGEGRRGPGFHRRHARGVRARGLRRGARTLGPKRAAHRLRADLRRFARPAPPAAAIAGLWRDLRRGVNSPRRRRASPLADPRFLLSCAAGPVRAVGGQRRRQPACRAAGFHFSTICRRSCCTRSRTPGIWKHGSTPSGPVHARDRRQVSSGQIIHSRLTVYSLRLNAPNSRCRLSYWACHSPGDSAGFPGADFVPAGRAGVVEDRPGAAAGLIGAGRALAAGAVPAEVLAVEVLAAEVLAVEVLAVEMLPVEVLAFGVLAFGVLPLEDFPNCVVPPKDFPVVAFPPKAFPVEGYPPKAFRVEASPVIASPRETSRFEAWSVHAFATDAFPTKILPGRGPGRRSVRGRPVHLRPGGPRRRGALVARHGLLLCLTAGWDERLAGRALAAGMGRKGSGAGLGG